MRRVVVLVAGVALLAGCGWARPRFDAGNTGDNTAETTITKANVASLVEQFRAPGATPDVAPRFVVARGHLYVGGSPARVVDATGATACGGAPRTCLPQWTVLANSEPDVMGSTLYWGTNATDADGVTGCSGSPKQCDVLWIDTGTGIPTGAVDPYGLHFTLGGYSAHGGESVYLYGHRTPEPASCGFNCSSAWATFLGAGSPGGIVGGPALGGTTVFASYSAVGAPNGTLYAFDGTDAAGPKRWSATLPGAGSDFVAVGDGVVVTVVQASAGSELVAYDAAGVTNCSGAPTVCQPLWVSDPWTGAGFDAAPAIADGRVYRAVGNQLRAYDLHGVTGCSGSPKVCQKLWVGGTASGVTAPAVANGLVYLGDGNGHVDAFDAAGATGCSATTHVCGPLWDTPVGSAIGAVEVAGGRVYASTADGTVRAFGLPAPS